MLIVKDMKNKLCCEICHKKITRASFFYEWNNKITCNNVECIKAIRNWTQEITIE